MPITPSTHIYKRVEDCSIHADVYLPPDPRGTAILWLHGGALILGSRAMLPAAQVDRYLQAGYVVIAADYRLAPETKLRAIVTDVQDAYGWLCSVGPERFGIDRDRIALVGHSAGGYLALLAGCGLRPRPRAIVSFYGYGDIVGAWYSQPDGFYGKLPRVPTAEAYRVVGGAVIAESDVNDRGRFYLYCRQQGLWPREVAGYDPHLEPQRLHPFCPIHNLTPDYPPTLLIHGEADTDVPAQQSRLMAQALARHGIEHELLSVPARGHAFDVERAAMQDPVVAQAFERTLAFLKKHVENA